MSTKLPALKFPHIRDLCSFSSSLFNGYKTLYKLFYQMDLLKLWQTVVSVVKDFWPNKKQMYVATLVGNSRYTILIYAENFRKLLNLLHF